MSGVANRALDPSVGLRRRAAFPRARDGFEAILRAMDVGFGDRVLMPAYVGWSAREGSGVHDPVRAVGAEADFFRVDRSLRVDGEDFRAALERGPRLVVLIHYFGFPDPAYPEHVQLARSAGVPILEDEAHALFTDLALGGSGRLGDAAIFSLHKALPCLVGGELRVNASAPEAFVRALDAGSSIEGALDPSDFDLQAIALRRRENALALREAVGPSIEPLWPELPERVAPQSWPVLIHGTDRDALYERMKAEGWGGTSLYHTMIPEISAEAFPDSHWLARRIFNLPVHQDATPDDMREMAAALVRAVS